MSKHHFESSPCLKEMPGLELDAVCEKTKRGDILVNFPKQASIEKRTWNLFYFKNHFFLKVSVLGERKNPGSVVGSVRFE